MVGCGDDDSSTQTNNTSSVDNGGTVSNTFVDDTPKEPEYSVYDVAYAPILQQYCDYLFNGVKENSDISTAIYWMHLSMISDRSLELDDLKVGYKLVDIDDNGVPELVIYRNDIIWQDGVGHIANTVVDKVAEIYTIKDGIATMLVQADTKYNALYCEDGVIGGWHLGSESFYNQLEDGEMIGLIDEEYEVVPAPVGELTMLTAETEFIYDYELSSIDRVSMVNCIKIGLTERFEKSAVFYEKQEVIYTNLSGLIGLTATEREQVFEHMELLSGDKPVIATTKAEIEAMGYYFTGSDWQPPSDADPDSVRFDGVYLTPSIIKTDDDEYEMWVDFTLYELKWDSELEEYTMEVLMAMD